MSFVDFNKFSLMTDNFDDSLMKELSTITESSIIITESSIIKENKNLYHKSLPQILTIKTKRQNMSLCKISNCRGEIRYNDLCKKHLLQIEINPIYITKYPYIFKYRNTNIKLCRVRYCNRKFKNNNICQKHMDNPMIKYILSMN